jgi:hypothetical protein
MLDVFPTYLLYLFYGMIFFAMGVAITSRDTSASNLKVAPFLWLFGLFAYTHAFHEWFELYLIVLCRPFPTEFTPLIGLAKLAFKFTSFALLLLFGMGLFRIVFPGRYYRLSLVPLLLTTTWLASVFIFQTELTSSFFLETDSRIRNFLGFPAAIISGTGFILYARTVQSLSKKGLAALPTPDFPWPCMAS